MDVNKENMLNYLSDIHYSMSVYSNQGDNNFSELVFAAALPEDLGSDYLVWSPKEDLANVVDKKMFERDFNKVEGLQAEQLTFDLGRLELALDSFDNKKSIQSERNEGTEQKTIFSVVQTSVAFPEQYDILDESGNEIGYMRLRNGVLSVSLQGKDIYRKEYDEKGKGFFDDDERDSAIKDFTSRILLARDNSVKNRDLVIDVVDGDKHSTLTVPVSELVDKFNKINQDRAERTFDGVQKQAEEIAYNKAMQMDFYEFEKYAKDVVSNNVNGLDVLISALKTKTESILKQEENEFESNVMRLRVDSEEDMDRLRADYSDILYLKAALRAKSDVAEEIARKNEQAFFEKIDGMDRERADLQVRKYGLGEFTDADQTRLERLSNEIDSAKYELSDIRDLPMEIYSDYDRASTREIIMSAKLEAYHDYWDNKNTIKFVKDSHTPFEQYNVIDESGNQIGSVRLEDGTLSVKYGDRDIFTTSYKYNDNIDINDVASRILFQISDRVKDGPVVINVFNDLQGSQQEPDAASIMSNFDLIKKFSEYNSEQYAYETDSKVPSLIDQGVEVYRKFEEISDNIANRYEALVESKGVDVKRFDELYVKLDGNPNATDDEVNRVAKELFITTLTPEVYRGIARQYAELDKLSENPVVKRLGEEGIGMQQISDMLRSGKSDIPLEDRNPSSLTPKEVISNALGTYGDPIEKAKKPQENVKLSDVNLIGNSPFNGVNLSNKVLGDNYSNNRFHNLKR